MFLMQERNRFFFSLFVIDYNLEGTNWLLDGFKSSSEWFIDLHSKDWKESSVTQKTHCMIMMNFVNLLFTKFYDTQNIKDVGTLYQL